MSARSLLILEKAIGRDKWIPQVAQSTKYDVKPQVTQLVRHDCTNQISFVVDTHIPAAYEFHNSDLINNDIDKSLNLLKQDKSNLSYQEDTKSSILPEGNKIVYETNMDLEKISSDDECLDNNSNYSFEDNLGDEKDLDFDILEYAIDTDEHSVISDEGSLPPQSLSNRLKAIKRYQQKEVHCRYCNVDLNTKNFARHMERHHFHEPDIETILCFPKKSIERRQAFIKLRNDTNFNMFLRGEIRPNQKRSDNVLKEFYPCAYCRGIFRKHYLKRHAKVCVNNQSANRNHLSASQTLTACAMDTTNTISLLNVKEQVFNLMKGDEIAFVAKKDLLIVYFGDSYLKKHKREKMAYACSNRMRELSRLLIQYRKLVNNNLVALKDIFVPNQFSIVISTVRNIAGYTPSEKSFKAPSLAMHLGTSLRLAGEELSHLILEEFSGFKYTTTSQKNERLTEVKNFIKLIKNRWTIELASLANKDLQEKKWSKPLLVPLVGDIKCFRDEVLKMAHKCDNTFIDNNDDQSIYKLLVHCTLALLILFNRRRIGDVQFLKIKDYKLDRKSNFIDFENALTESEKLLAKNYKRVVNGGKGSRAVVILIPNILQTFIETLLTYRHKYIPTENEYVFAVPGSSIKWGKGDVSFRILVKKMILTYPKAITSNRLRKHIATVMQILNLSKEEFKQFSNFMGHTEKTHEEYYELPVDIYQTAKVSKLLLMMEKGSLPMEYKGKSLSEIDIDLESTFVEEHEIEDSIILTETLTNCIETNSYTVDKMIIGKRETVSELAVPEAGLMESDGSIKGKRCRRGWLREEENCLRKEFVNFIESGNYPSGEEIKRFAEKNSIKRSVLNIKSKIQYLIKLERKHENLQ